jgi:alkylation response protein AidB-like acyl-CoA dehydrogenase
MEDFATKEVVQAAENGVWAEQLWNTLTEVGITGLGISEEKGGDGGSLGDVMAVLRIAGRHAAPVPLAETMMANWLLSTCGFSISNEPCTVAPVSKSDRFTARQTSSGWSVSGTASNVPWAAFAKGIIVIAESNNQSIVTLVDPVACTIKPGNNLANEPRNEVIMEGVPVESASAALLPAGISKNSVRRLGALIRTVMSVGALEQILDLSVQYSKERIQFGRPIARFQAIQQQLAAAAGEVMAASIAADFAVDAFEVDHTSEEVMLAKIRVGQAISTAVPIAHQVHGAIGFTDEYPLQLVTRRLWSWRGEFGGESEWADEAGRLILERGADELWPMITTSKRFLSKQ